MDELVVFIGIGSTLGIALGAVASWVLRGRQAEREMETAEGNWQRKLDQAVNKTRVLVDQATSLKVNLEASQKLALQSRHAAVSSSTELESALEKLKSLEKDLSATQAERDEYSSKLEQNQRQVAAARRRVDELTAEFEKSRTFYKGQIGNAINERHALERRVADLESEQSSLTTLLASAKAEHDSVNRMLTSARARLETLDALEQKVIALEADNAELRHKADKANRRSETLRRELDDLDELKAQNRELASCLESVENSRKQYESDAKRYRNRFEQSEKESETLRTRLVDIEKSLSKMQKEETRASGVVRIPTIGMDPPADGEGDDLTEIVGVGKVFEEMLHGLGIYYFRQIATFGPAELARVNAELKEFKGRIEHDDWIGQARELHFKKYGLKSSLPVSRAAAGATS